MDKETEDWVTLMLEDETFEELLERFNISVHEAFETLISAGLVDEELLKEMVGMGY